MAICRWPPLARRPFQEVFGQTVSPPRSSCPRGGRTQTRAWSSPCLASPSRKFSLVWKQWTRITNILVDFKNKSPKIINRMPTRLLFSCYFIKCSLCPLKWRITHKEIISVQVDKYWSGNLIVIIQKIITDMFTLTLAFKHLLHFFPDTLEIPGGQCTKMGGNWRLMIATLDWRVLF